MKYIIELYWVAQRRINPLRKPDYKINIRIRAANGEVLWTNAQGYRDTTDACRALDSLAKMFVGVDIYTAIKAANGRIEIQGPGLKP